MSSVGKAVGVVFLVLMFLGAGLMPAFAVSDEIENITINYSETHCFSKTTEIKAINKIEKNKVFKRVLNNEKVKKLINQLKKDGYTQKEMSAYILSTNSSDILIAEIKYYSSDLNNEKSIIYAYNIKTGETIVILGTGWECVLCIGLIAGCAACTGACGTIGPGCIACLITACGGAVYTCSCCCCGLTGSDYCCNICNW